MKNAPLAALQKSLEDAKAQIEQFPLDHRLVNEFDGVLDIEMGLDWTLKQVEFFATHFPRIHKITAEDADFDYGPLVEAN